MRYRTANICHYAPHHRVVINYSLEFRSSMHHCIRKTILNDNQLICLLSSMNNLLVIKTKIFVTQNLTI